MRLPVNSAGGEGPSVAPAPRFMLADAPGGDQTGDCPTRIFCLFGGDSCAIAKGPRILAFEAGNT